MTKTPAKNLSQPNHGKSRNFQTGPVLTISAIHFIHDIYSSFLAPLLPLLIEKLSLSLTRAALLSTIMQIPALLNPYLGAIADRRTGRWFIILTPATTAMPMSMIGLAPGFGVLAILLFVAGISAATFHVPTPVMISSLSGSQVGKGMSFFMTGGELARTVGPLAAIGAVSLFGLEGFFPVMLVGIIASIILYFKLKGQSFNLANKKNPTIIKTWQKMRHILFPLTVILIFRSFMHSAIVTFLPTFIQIETKNLWLSGVALTIYEASGVIGTLASGPMSDHFGRRQIILISIIVTPFCFLSFCWIQCPIRFVMLAFTGIFLLSTTPVMLALVQDHAKNSPSAANGLFIMISFIARSAIVLLVGMLGDMIGLKSTYVVSAFLGLLAIPFVMMLPDK